MVCVDRSLPGPGRGQLCLFDDLIPGAGPPRGHSALPSQGFSGPGGEEAGAGRGLAAGWAWQASLAAPTPPHPQARPGRLHRTRGWAGTPPGAPPPSGPFPSGAHRVLVRPRGLRWGDATNNLTARSAHYRGQKELPAQMTPPPPPIITIKCALACSISGRLQGRPHSGGREGGGRGGSPHLFPGDCTQLLTTPNPHPTSTWSRVWKHLLACRPTTKIFPEKWPK